MYSYFRVFKTNLTNPTNLCKIDKKLKNCNYLFKGIVLLQVRGTTSFGNMAITEKVWDCSFKCLLSHKHIRKCISEPALTCTSSELTNFKINFDELALSTRTVFFLGNEEIKSMGWRPSSSSHRMALGARYFSINRVYFWWKSVFNNWRWQGTQISPK